MYTISHSLQGLSLALDCLKIVCAGKHRYRFRYLFLEDFTNTSDTVRWTQLRSLTLEGLLLTPNQEGLVQSIATHAATLRYLRLRDCDVSPSSITSIAAITSLRLYSLRVECSSLDSVALVSEDSLLQFVNKETTYNSMTSVSLQIAEGKAAKFSTCDRRWEALEDLYVFKGCDPVNTKDGIISDDDFNRDPEHVYREADAESVLSDDSDTPWRAPPRWTWGRFYHEDEYGEVYFWQVEPGYASYSWRTHVWKLICRDGEVVYVTSAGDRARALVMEPPEEFFEDWDSSAGDRIEPTPHAQFEVQLISTPLPEESNDLCCCTKDIIGPGRKAEFLHYIKAQKPPEGAIKESPLKRLMGSYSP